MSQSCSHLVNHCQILLSDCLDSATLPQDIVIICDVIKIFKIVNIVNIVTIVNIVYIVKVVRNCVNIVLTVCQLGVI